MKNIAISILDIENNKLDEFLNKLSNIVKDNKLTNIVIHFDVMDGKFVDNIGVDLEDIKLVKKYGFYVDVHLMVENPDKYIEEAYKLGADNITIHSEIEDLDKHIYKLYCLKEVSDKFTIGLAISPDSNLDNVVKYNNIIDLALVMSVYPGYGNQTLITTTLDKIAALKQIVHYIEVDGGINDTNISNINNLGADICVMGSFFTKNIELLEENILKINDLIK